MGNTEVIMQLLWDGGYMDTYNDVCTYYTLWGQEDGPGNTII